jgi:NAD(P)-dependent dehydrogenase (short-subunit alcohol dehydrogenase family)
MERFLEGRAAVVTGGTRGIGRAVAEALVGAGAAVAICGRSEESVSRAVAELGAGGGKVAGRAADVSDAAEVAALFRMVDERLGGLDILVNNAGIGAFASVADLTVEQWRRTIGTNLDGVFYCCREAMPRFRQRGGGFAINIGSLAGRNPFAGGAAYNASKFGLIGLTEAMMLDHRYENVRAAIVMPGSVDTRFGGGPGGGAEWKSAPEDIAEAVMDLLRMPARSLVSRVEIRPSRPKKG